MAEVPSEPVPAIITTTSSKLSPEPVKLAGITIVASQSPTSNAGSPADPGSIQTEASTKPLISAVRTSPTVAQQVQEKRPSVTGERAPTASKRASTQMETSPKNKEGTSKRDEVGEGEKKESQLSRPQDVSAVTKGFDRTHASGERPSQTVKGNGAVEKASTPVRGVNEIKKENQPGGGGSAASGNKSGSKNSLSANNMIGTHYKVGKKIGEGSFGVIYEGLNMLNNVPIAIKFEPRKSDAPQLRDEYKTYRLLANSIGIPNAYYFGQEGLHNVLCIDLLGPSLEDMFDLCHRKFSVKTTCMVAKQMISRVQTIHEKNLIYRDIKPDNFLIGRLSRYEPTPILQAHSATHPHPSSMVYMVDFGMAKQYRDPKTKVHIPYREKKSLSGTARYMSINTHLGREQSRRDDLEALGHVFFYFLRGSLPWQGLKAATNKQKYEKIGEKKQNTPIKELCEGHPEEFNIYQNYVRDLKFDAEPDYELLKGLMNKVLAKNGFIDDGIYDWMIELDHQRTKKERQRAADQQGRKGAPDASTAAVHQSIGDTTAAPNSNTQLRPSVIVERNASTAPLREKNEQGPTQSVVPSMQDSKDGLKANAAATGVATPKTPLVKEPREAGGELRKSAEGAPNTGAKGNGAEESPNKSATKAKEKAPPTPTKLKSIWCACCGRGGE